MSLEKLSNALIMIFIAFIILIPLIPAVRRTVSRQTIAGIVLTIGILGTFVGVTIALFSFDFTKGATSIEELIQGLKLAFLTSLAGITTNIILRFRKDWKNNSNNGHKVNYSEAVINHLAQIARSLGDSNESPLISQVQHLRNEIHLEIQSLKTTTNDTINDLKNRFEIFSNTVAEQNNSALIESLQKVFENFNDEISKQLGGNFRELNQSIGNLNRWQQEHVETIKRTNEEIELIHKSLEEIYQRSNEFYTSIYDWKNTQVEFNNTIGDTRRSVENLKKTSLLVLEQTPRMNFLMETSIEKLNKIIEKANSDLDTHLVRVANEQEKILKGFGDSINNLLHKSNEQIIEYREQTDGEIQKTIESLGSGLLSMSNSFVSKYSELKEVITKLGIVIQNIENKS